MRPCTCARGTWQVVLPPPRFSAFRVEVFCFHAVVSADCSDDVVGGEFLFFKIDSSCNDAAGEFEVDFAVVHDCTRHDGVDDSFQFPDAAFHILCNILDHFFRELESVASDFREEDVFAQL